METTRELKPWRRPQLHTCGPIGDEIARISAHISSLNRRQPIDKGTLSGYPVSFRRELKKQIPDILVAILHCSRINDFVCKLDTYSAANWTVVPAQTGHLFHAKLYTLAQRRGVEVWFYSGRGELVKLARFFASNLLSSRVGGRCGPGGRGWRRPVWCRRWRRANVQSEAGW